MAVFGQRLPAYHAVLANVMMCHALEIDDSHYPAIVHPTAPMLWAGLATAEQVGGVSGREFMTAVVLGIDAMARIALAAPRTLDNGYHTAIYSGFGAAVTAAKLLKLDFDMQMPHDRVAALVRSCEQLENLPDARELVRLLNLSRNSSSANR